MLSKKLSKLFMNICRKVSVRKITKNNSNKHNLAANKTNKMSLLADVGVYTLTTGLKLKDGNVISGGEMVVEVK